MQDSSQPQMRSTNPVAMNSEDCKIIKKIIGNHKKNHRKHVGIIMAIVGPCMGEMCLNHTFESFLELFRFRLVQ